MKKRRRRKIKRTPPPWKFAIGVALLAHGIVIAVVITLGWHQFSIVKPGSAIFVSDVVIGDSEGGQEQQQTRSNSLLPRGEGGRRPDEGDVHVKAPSPQPSPEGEGDSNSVTGNAGGISTGSGNEAGGTGSGSGTGGAGNPILAEIRRRIESAKRYPAQAREQHIEGKVGVQFYIQSNGQVSSVRVTHPSGAPVLDEAAIQAVQHSAPLPYYEHPIDLSLAFRLR